MFRVECFATMKGPRCRVFSYNDKLMTDEVLCRRNNGHRRASKRDGQKSQGTDAADVNTAQLADLATPDMSGQSPGSSCDSAEYASKAARRAAAKLADSSAGTPPGPKKKPWSEGTLQARAEEAVKRGPSGATMEWLEPESDEGNAEYKLRLKDPSTMRFQQLVSFTSRSACLEKSCCGMHPLPHQHRHT